LFPVHEVFVSRCIDYSRIAKKKGGQEGCQGETTRRLRAGGKGGGEKGLLDEREKRREYRKSIKSKTEKDRR